MSDTKALSSKKATPANPHCLGSSPSQGTGAQFTLDRVSTFGERKLSKSLAEVGKNVRDDSS